MSQNVITPKTLIPVGVVGAFCFAAFLWGVHYRDYYAQVDRVKAIEDMRIADQLSRMNVRLVLIEQHLNIRIRDRAALDTTSMQATPLPQPIQQIRPRRAVAIPEESQ